MNIAQITEFDLDQRQVERDEAFARYVDELYARGDSLTVVYRSDGTVDRVDIARRPPRLSIWRRVLTLFSGGWH